MNEEQKEKLQAGLEKGAAHAFAAAKGKTGWLRWVLIGAGLIATAAAAWLMNSCTATYSQTAGGNIKASVIVVPLNECK